MMHVNASDVPARWEILGYWHQIYVQATLPRDSLRQSVKG